MSRLSHPEWCARGAGCALGEHRAAPLSVMTLGPAGAPMATGELTRVSDPAGRDLVEIWLRVALPPGDEAAHLVTALAELRAVVDRLGGRR
jgi:hypothetical protein